MKTDHLALPTLQIAAALFLGSSGVVHAADDMAETYCIDANDLIVDMSECNEDAAPQSFFLIDAAPGGTVGDKVMGAIPGTKIDSSEPNGRDKRYERFSSGGFGKRSNGTDDDETAGRAGRLGGSGS